MVDVYTQRKLLFVVVFIVISIPFALPVPIKIDITEPTLAAYNTIESMPDGSIAFLDWDFSSMSAPELYPQALAFLKHAIRKEFKFVIATFWSPDAILFCKRALASEVDLSGYEYGVDYVHLGFFPGGETSVAAFGRDIHRLVKTDVYGNSIDDMPLMQQLNDARDFDIWLLGHYQSWQFINQIGAPYEAILVAACDSGSFPGNLNRYKAGQFAGVLNGIRGAAEYEKILDYRGDGFKIMGAQSFSHILMISVIIIGNLMTKTVRRSKQT